MMNREIKFRAFNKVTKEMWLPEHLNMNGYTLNVLTGQINYLDKENFDYESPEIPYSVFLDEHLIPMQFTGLKDKYGVEIYEGDILKGFSFKPYPFVVSWATEKSFYCGFVAKGLRGEFEYVLQNDNFLGAEVIGNIHQNPELMEQSK
jgi:uncharacterized phage protein (TIGR01671 family)